MATHNGINFAWIGADLGAILSNLINDADFLITSNESALSVAIAEGHSPQEIKRLKDTIYQLKNARAAIESYNNNLKPADVYTFSASDNSAQRLLSLMSLNNEYAFGSLPVIPLY